MQRICASQEEDGEVDQLEETGGKVGISSAASTALADEVVVDDDAADSSTEEYLLNLDGDRDLNRASSSGEGEDEEEEYQELLADNDDDFDVEIRAEKHDPFPDRDSFPARPGVTEGFATWKQAVEEESEALLKGSIAGPLAFNCLFPVAHGIYECIVATATPAGGRPVRREVSVAEPEPRAGEGPEPVPRAAVGVGREHLTADAARNRHAGDVICRRPGDDVASNGRRSGSEMLGDAGGGSMRHAVRERDEQRMPFGDLLEREHQRELTHERTP